MSNYRPSCLLTPRGQPRATRPIRLTNRRNRLPSSWRRRQAVSVTHASWVATISRFSAKWQALGWSESRR
ncbi:hypothetical protein, partial [Micromonospora sp. NPDC005324]|uniref:hypothetical protein n=1 Tax=Micromonospora sp. NPDC005324 TaxID=3157033 RepID=UPI0033B4C5BE